MRNSGRDLEPMLYSPTQVAWLIGLSRTKTYELIKSGGLPAIRVAGQIRVRREALLAWIRSQPQTR